MKTEEATPTVDRRQHLSKLDSLRYPTEYQAPIRERHDESKSESEQSTRSSNEKKPIRRHHSPQERGRETKKEGENIFNRIARSMSPGALKHRVARRRSRSPRRPARARPRRNLSDSSDKEFLEAMDELGV
jgi:hypothetical protein